MSEKKLNIRQAAQGIASIVEKHLSKLPPDEQEARMRKLRKRAKGARMTTK